MFAGQDLSLVALVGIVLLMGIVKKNAIILIDFALEAERLRGLSPRQAIEEACALRYRPIMMTTAAALLGALPLMLEHGTGSELRLPAGPDDRGRSAAEPGADALHDAGNLPVLRTHPAPLHAGAAGAGGSELVQQHSHTRGLTRVSTRPRQNICCPPEDSLPAAKTWHIPPAWMLVSSTSMTGLKGRWPRGQSTQNTVILGLDPSIHAGRARTSVAHERTIRPRRRNRTCRPRGCSCQARAWTG